ncbi:MAG: class I SAM-dependent methyltransferase [Candidatus Peribacteraceae bacterium]|nr:class I SAM-dependent methyltransferase [Candidatus Peribacteraceae bacterium]MDD5074792.1 class I SAM-dependent methyltransferase [Candidatus Peribacteraceae bacterium]
MNIATYAVREIPFDELPAWSPWPARLLGLTDWKPPVRTEKKVDSEYDKDEYLRCLAFAKEHPAATPEEVRAFEFRMEERKTFCVSVGEALHEIPAERVIPIDSELLIETMQPLMDKVDTVVELGCGYGINLWTLQQRFPGKRYVGGEYSPNAVTLAHQLYKNIPEIQVEPFNFYDASYALFAKLPPTAKILVFTRHAIEQLPSAQAVLAGLAPHFPNIVAGVHLEPTIGNYSDSVFGLLMRKYIVINDYNRDLLQLLTDRKDVSLLKNDPNVYGVSPLNPTSILVWKPKK